jgi:hypothetical protein
MKYVSQIPKTTRLVWLGLPDIFTYQVHIWCILGAYCAQKMCLCYAFFLHICCTSIVYINYIMIKWYMCISAAYQVHIGCISGVYRYMYSLHILCIFSANSLHMLVAMFLHRPRTHSHPAHHDPMIPITGPSVPSSYQTIPHSGWPNSWNHPIRDTSPQWQCQSLWVPWRPLSDLGYQPGVWCWQWASRRLPWPACASWTGSWFKLPLASCFWVKAHWQPGQQSCQWAPVAWDLNTVQVRWHRSPCV